MKRVLMLRLAVALCVALTIRAEAKGPNVILIVADDLGYGDLGIHGGKDIPTPHIDSLAAAGTRFSSGYVSCPVCSPTRAGLMTGRYQQRFGHEFNPGPRAAANFGLPLTESTIGDALRAGGYKTALVGKWHLGGRPDYLPQKRGFDEFYGFLAGAHPYLPAREAAAGTPDAPADAQRRRRRQQQQARGRAPILRGTEPVPDPEYLTDAFADEAVAYIEKHKAEPYFLYLPFNAVHNPQHATRKYLDRFPNLPAGRKTYAAMLSAMDDAIGRVLDTVRRNGQEQDTLIFFISDNGGPPANHSTNGPLNGRKGTVYEGGIRVPFIVQWKGTVPAGKVLDQPVIALDILPTALAATGITAPSGKQLDGLDLLPLLTGKDGAAASKFAGRKLYWRFGPQWAVRDGDWKLLSARDGQVCLFNLNNDLGEKTDLAGSDAQRVQSLRAAWEQWSAQLEAPRWSRRQ